VDKFAGERVSMRVKYPCLMENLYDRYSWLVKIGF
jgi:hypothetical protein